ncbi:MAG: hypothetical protein MSC30_12775 [Gaiellaceae bacterium MAG52_C11]|nr:hypothetical protein [Candidatus Gaiellasilicea maunaloa]
MRSSRTIRSATSAVTSAEPTAVGIASTTSAPTSWTPAATGGPEEVGRRHPARLGSPRSGCEGRVEHVHVDRDEDRAGTDALQGALEDGANPELADVVHEVADDPLLGLPAELRRPGPAAAQPDLDIGRPAVHRGDGADVGFGDRVVAAEDDRDRARLGDLADERLDRRV